MSRDSAPRILITRLSALGDCVLTLPLLCAARRALPDARITWVVQAAGAQLLRGHDCLDELVVVSRRWLKSPGEIWRLRRTLRAQRFDVALDPQSLAKSAVAAWLSGARRRIGFAPPAGREQSHWLYHERITPVARHIVPKQLELLAPLGIQAPAVEFRLPAYPDEAHRVAAWRQPLIGSSFLTLNPGAAWPSKQWPAPHFSEVACEVGRRHGLPSLVVWGNAQERELAESICQKAHGHAVLAPATNLRELACVLRQSRLVISGDTGPLHMAVAAGTPCVGLYGTTRPCDSGPYGPRHIALQAYYHGGTSRERRTAGNDALRAITPQQAAVACDMILSRSRKRDAA